MGTFRVHVQAVGNHGCQREKSGTDVITGCGQPNCTDCITREFIRKLKASGASVSQAHIHHWPDTTLARADSFAGDVVDNLLSERRLGRFN